MVVLSRIMLPKMKRNEIVWEYVIKQNQWIRSREFMKEKIRMSLWGFQQLGG